MFDIDGETTANFWPLKIMSEQLKFHIDQVKSDVKTTLFISLYSAGEFPWRLVTAPVTTPSVS